MASSNFLQRFVLVLLPAAGLVSCVGDGMAPPTEVGAARPARSSRAAPEGRVGDRELLGPVGAPAAYAPAPAATSRASVAIDYLDTPNLAGVNGQPDEDPLGVNDPRGAPSLAVADQPMLAVDPEPALMREQALQQPMPQTAAYAIPAEGVNIDAELGVGGENPLGVGEAAPRAPIAPVAAQILVPQGPMAIAEGQTSQPVVDGIGTDNPTPVLLPQGQAADPSL
jgi:hypothetical protein